MTDTTNPEYLNTELARLADQDTITEKEARKCAKDFALPHPPAGGRVRGFNWLSLLRLGAVLAGLLKRITAAAATGAGALAIKIVGRRMLLSAFDLDAVDAAAAAGVTTSDGGYVVTARKV